MSVFLADVDDYVAPSQACINPMFSPSNAGGKKEDDEATDGRQTKASKNRSDTAGTGAIAVNRKRIHRSAKYAASAQSPSSFGAASKTVSTGDRDKQRTADIADCLACSGCVTTAETVLLRQHSIDQFRAAMNSSVQEASDRPSPDLVITLSPASAAELLRMLAVDDDELVLQVQADLSRSNRQLAALLCQELNARAIVDGALPLSWSLHQAGVDFCQHYRRQASGADRRRNPMISSSCPAAVCLIEKNHHYLVPSLTRVKSPMAAAGVYLSTVPGQSLYHVAIMPCHDKKLEATRNDVRGVDLVLTTQECWQLLVEQQQSRGNPSLPSAIQRLKTQFRSLPPSTVEWVDGTRFSTRNSSLPANKWISCSAPVWTQPPFSSADASSLIYTSGGYADFVFRYASWQLFGASIARVPWASATSTPGMGKVTPASARVAQARRDVLVVALYEHCSVDSSSYTGSSSRWYSCAAKPALPETNGGSAASHFKSVTSTPVLRFAMAHGMQSMLRTLVAATEGTPSNGDSMHYTPAAWDYIEAMACPSGCLNGGGQALSTNATPFESSPLPKPTPSSTRERVGQTARFLDLPRRSADGSSPEEPDENNKPVVVTEVSPELRASFQVVKPLRIQKGAAAGSAVKDLQW